MLKRSALWASAAVVGPRGLFAQAASPAATSPAATSPAATSPVATPEKASYGSAVFQPNWESLRDNYQPPEWMRENRLGIFIHWGLYSIPARINEWYGRHMYTSDVAWHTAHYGAPDKFGYKDFIPLFKAEKF
jgi:alpha-L-fucosidase